MKSEHIYIVGHCRNGERGSTADVFIPRRIARSLPDARKAALSLKQMSGVNKVPIYRIRNGVEYLVEVV